MAAIHQFGIVAVRAVKIAPLKEKHATDLSGIINERIFLDAADDHRKASSAMGLKARLHE